MRYQLIITAFLLLNLLNGNIFAQNDSIPHKIIPINFKVGINTNYLMGNSDFEGGYNGWGIFIEPHLTERISFLFSYNFTNIRTKPTKNRMIEFDELKTRESFMLVRGFFKYRNLNIFPEIGMGTWQHDIGYFLLGTGIDFKVYQSFYLTFNIDYSLVDYHWLYFEGNRWSSSFLKLTISLSHLFKFKLKGGPVPENPH